MPITEWVNTIEQNVIILLCVAVWTFKKFTILATLVHTQWIVLGSKYDAELEQFLV